MTTRNTNNTTTKRTRRNATLDKKLDALTTKASKIRLLDAEGWTRSEIAARLGVRYQHVRNVLITPVTKPRQ